MEVPHTKYLQKLKYRAVIPLNYVRDWSTNIAEFIVVVYRRILYRRVTSKALVPSYDCPSAREATLKNMRRCTNPASFTNEVNSRLARRPLVFNGHLSNHELTSLVKEATGTDDITTAKQSTPNRNCIYTMWLTVPKIRGLFNIKMPSWQYKFLSQNKMVSQQFYFYDGNHTHGPLARYVKLWVAHAPGMSGTFFPATMG